MKSIVSAAVGTLFNYMNIHYMPVIYADWEDKVIKSLYSADQTDKLEYEAKVLIPSIIFKDNLKGLIVKMENTDDKDTGEFVKLLGEALDMRDEYGEGYGFTIDYAEVYDSKNNLTASTVTIKSELLNFEYTI